MNRKKPTYEELESRLTEAEATLDALRNERIDAVVGKEGVYLLRLQDTEKALQQERARLEAVLQQLPEGVLITEAPSGRLILGNYQAARIWGESSLSSEGITDYAQCRMFHPDGREYRLHERPVIRTITAGEAIKDEEIQFERKDGSLGWMSVSSRPIRDEKANVVSGVVTFSDITERKQIEKSLRDYRDELESTVQERTADLASLTEQLRRLTMQLMVNESIERDRIARLLHDELQQLLVGAKIPLELISEDVKPRQKEALAKSAALIVSCIRMSRSLTEELAPQALAEEDMAGIVKWLSDFMKKTHNLTVQTRVDHDIKIHDRDVRLFLYQSLRELLFNVVKHAHTLTATVRLKKDPAGNIKITVSDTGDGFDTARMAREQDAGGKFGLFSMRERLSFLGGSMKMESVPGDGTTCTLTLPLADTDSVEAEGESASKVNVFEADSAQIRLLVVDDHQAVREGFAAVFQREPDITLVGEAETGREGIDKALALVPDVILMDTNMPETNGIQATRTIRNRLPDVRIIGLSVEDSQTIKDAMMVAGATDFLSKDSSAKEILAAIRNHQE
ncbi:MAG: response regulator [Desulfobacteraceae bacterium]